MKDVLGVISNTPALNVEAITLPQNASRENQLSPPLALSHPVQLPTPVKVNRLHFYLDGYPTKLKDYLLNGFQHGFLLAYVGPHKPSSCKNLLSATQNPVAVSDKLSKELSLGRIAGPFLERPFPSLRISPLGLIPKKTPGEFRLIHHLSFPYGDSINSCIPNDASTVKYASIDDAVRLIRRTGRGCALAKTDVKNAFRLIPINPCDYDLLGFWWEDSFYFVRACRWGPVPLVKFGKAFQPFSSGLLSLS